MTKEEVLQRANDYCNERSYDASTLTDDFKDKFADFFVKKNPDGDINDENVLADLKFNLDTAKSAASKGRATLQVEFTTKENGLKNQIAELERKINGQQPKPQQQTLELPEEVKTQLQELEKFKNEEAKKSKFAEIVELAKKGIRQDLHGSFDTYAKDYEAKLDATSEEQAKRLTDRFQAIFKDSIGDIKPLAPKQTQKQDEEFLNSLPKIKVK